MTGTFFLISAPSGAGKTTLVSLLLSRIQQYSIKRVITYTSREAAREEVDGIDYHFISEQVFKQKIDTGFFLEWSKDYGHYYGSPVAILDELKKGTSFIGVLDRRGVASVLQVCVAVPIWIYTDIETLRARLYQRGRDSQEAIECRLTQASKELEREKHESLFRYHILNDDIERAVNELEHIVCHYLSKQMTSE